MVIRHSKFPRRATGGCVWSIFPWLLGFLCLGLLGWIFYKHMLPPKKLTPPAPPTPGAPLSVNARVYNPLRTTNLLLERTAVPQPLPLSSNPTPAPAASNRFDAAAQAWMDRIVRAQLALVRQGISPGCIDGVLGSQTRAALRTFQVIENLPATGQLDAATCERLGLEDSRYTEYMVTSRDLARLQPLGKSWLEKSEQSRLDYETLLELVAEKHQSHPNLICRLNPDISWTNLWPGAVLKVPRPEFPPVQTKACLIKIFLSQRILEAFDQDTNLLAQFPCSIGQRMEKRPVGELHVAVRAHNPNYTFDPEVFPESPEARELGRKLLLQPGPNNPVGTVWIGLDKPGYGIHGTPRPEQVGRTESHGCFRLANWNAEYLAKMVWVGLPVVVEP